MAKKANNKGHVRKAVVTLTHDEASRKNIPTAEYESVMKVEQQSPLRVAYERRNRDLDPQLVWRGKDEQDWSDLVVPAPPLFIQEKVHPKVLIDDLLRQAEAARIAKKLATGEAGGIGPQIDLFADFNGLPDNDAKTDFYAHDAHWSNRMILGDSLQVMASLAEREGLRGKVQCIYIDPPYGIKFNSNFQWSTTSRDVKDSVDNMTREPEQVKAFRDTWRDGIHSYMTYLRDRLTAARDLLAESGSIFIQIGDENVHRVRDLLDEVFGSGQFAALITFRKKMMPLGSDVAEGVSDYLLWYCKNRDLVKARPLFHKKEIDGESVWSSYMTNDGRRIKAKEASKLDSRESRVYQPISLLPAQYRPNQDFKFTFEGREWDPPKKSSWKTDLKGMSRLLLANRLHPSGSNLRYILFHADYPVGRMTNLWAEASAATQQVYVVQTNTDVVARCILMTTDPGDLVLDPTCGSGTAAYVAEQWGRRWITIDTSRVALALARARIMGARYPYYIKADSREGQLKEAEISHSEPNNAATHDSLRQGFVYERVPHITLKSIANNAEIDVIWAKFESVLLPARQELSAILGKKRTLEEWEIERQVDPNWPARAKGLHSNFWAWRTGRQKEIDASIATKAEFEFLYDKPYVDAKKVRVAGPFTVESLSPHRTLDVGPDDELIDPFESGRRREGGTDFATMILDNLRMAGVQQAHKDGKIAFTSLTGWPGNYICAEARYADSDGTEKRAGIFIGPEFGTVSRKQLVTAALEAGDANFDALIACAFNYEALASEFNKIGRIPVLKARMNAELHMGTELKNTGKGNLFVIFGEPDIRILPPVDAPEDADLKNYDMIRVRINGVDVFHPQTGEVRSDGSDGIACWFIDTDYNEESFFVRQAYFLGANDPYKSLKTTLRAEINEEAWATLNSDTSQAFPKPKDGKIAVKVINHLGDEVMKVFKVA